MFYEQRWGITPSMLGGLFTRGLNDLGNKVTNELAQYTRRSEETRNWLGVDSVSLERQQNMLYMHRLSHALLD